MAKKIALVVLGQGYAVDPLIAALQQLVPVSSKASAVERENGYPARCVEMEIPLPDAVTEKKVDVLLDSARDGVQIGITSREE